MGRFGRLSVSGSAGGDYFKVVGLDLIQGREFVAADRREIPEVAIVTERLASQLFDDAALGRSLRVSTPFRGAVEADLRIVGVVESPVGLSGEEVPAIFFPSPFPSPIQRGTARTLHVRSEGPAAALAPAIRDLVAQLDPQVPILELATLDQTIRADILLQRMLARAAALLGIVALLLASVGLYGVTSYSVAMRAAGDRCSDGAGCADRPRRRNGLAAGPGRRDDRFRSRRPCGDRGRTPHSGGGLRCRRNRCRDAERIGGVACSGHAPGQHPAGPAGRPAGPVCGAARRVGSMADSHSALTDEIEAAIAISSEPRITPQCR